MTTQDLLTIGTRGSALALWQANHIKAQLEATHTGISVRIRTIKTTGDKITDVPLAMVGGKGLFVKEIEDALLRGDVDLAVHSMKDVPTDLPDRLEIAFVTQREDPRDAFISPNGATFLSLPPGAVIGTSSLRRQSQLRFHRPDVVIASLRGNLDTRLRKLSDGRYAAIILAAAGLKRLGLEDRVSEYLSTEISLPAIGQGALGIECRRGDARTQRLAATLGHSDTHTAVLAERALLKRLEGGCQVPIAAYGRLVFDHGAPNLLLEGLVASVDGTRLIRDRVSGSPADAVALGIDLAEKLLGRGADRILREIYESG